MERHFERELGDLKELLLLMGGRAENSIQKAIAALSRRDPALARQVLADDKAIDRLEIEIEERCVNLLALQQPLARDLRFITAVLKISNDLERVGDHGVNIAGNVLNLIAEPHLSILADISKIAILASAMLRESLDSFVKRDSAAARALVRRDDAVDELNRRLFHELAATMCKDPASIHRALELILISRNLERVADLATNIAEEVVFIAEARIIKHHAEETS